MEIAVKEEMPTYSGGLGVLAGDTILAALDLKVPMVAVTLLYRKGYCYQKIDSSGRQTEAPNEWAIEDYLEELPQRVRVDIDNRSIQLRAWRFVMKSSSGFSIPIYFLDANLFENSEYDKALSDYLYGGDQYYRLCQEVILGIGGVRILRSLGHQQLNRFHMNEGHASFLTLELIEESRTKASRQTIAEEDIENVRRQCVFTTHTPVSAALDKFPMDLMIRVLGNREVFNRKDIFCCEGVLNMTYLALNLSHYVNGVAKKHGEISNLMFGRYSIDSITNGVNVSRWVSIPFQELYERHIPSWKKDNFSLRYALNIPKNEIWDAHARAKEKLIQYVNQETSIGMDHDLLTIGFARRAAVYKRGDLLFQDLERLKSIVKYKGGVQVVYAGKAHPKDVEGKEMIQRIYRAKELLKKDVRIVYLENYDIELAKLITSGVDLWLNTPQIPLEASGTSGMKAALNGIPSLSILDGWWIEGCIEGITGWSIADIRQNHDSKTNSCKDAFGLYEKLENVIIPMFYAERDKFISIMQHCIALNGSFFNSQRMLQQYVLNAYFK
ncbi:MAG: alpha-glucan family phosphorylase [Verrucomicrobia bacterium]|nr:alpha-glucan family phosphorylase [Verrucomicrobiota bacterium]